MTKIYLFFNQGAWRIMHTLAAKLQAVDAVSGVAAMTDHKRVYDSIQEQSTVEYEFLHCVPNVHNDIVERSISDSQLSSIEDKFGNPSLRDFVIAQRNYANFPEDHKKELIGKWFQFYSQVFNDFGTDMFISPSTASAHSWIPYRMTDRTGGTAVSLKSTRIENRYALMINNAMDHFPEVFSLFKSFLSGDDSPQGYPNANEQASKYILDFRQESTNKTPDYFSIPQKSPELSNLSALPSKLMTGVRYWIKYHTNIIQPNYVRGDYRRDSFSHKIIEEIKNLIRRSYLNQSDFFYSPDYDEKFVFFPLHLQPEASTLILAPMFVNQVALCQQIARSLPINYALYVKPNPNMFGWRKIQYYNRLKKISDVRLIHPLVDSHELIEQSEVVTTITGTAGLEGVLYQKPTVVFGEVNYDMMDMSYKCNNIQDLSETIFTAIYEHTHSEKELHQYLTAVFENSISLDNSLFYHTDKDTEDDADKILSLIAEYI